MAKYHGLSNIENAIDIRDGFEFVFLSWAPDVMLFNVIQRLLFTVQPIKKNMNKMKF